MKDHLVILGSHPRTRTEVNFDDPNIDIWAFNEVLVHPGFCKRADAIFQMHPRTIWNNPMNAADGEAAREWLKTQDVCDVWMVDDFTDEIPRCKVYPFDEIVATLLPNWTLDSAKKRKAFFGSSVAYSTALGIYLGYKTIEWYGIELEQEDEYRFQVPSAMFWAGIAIGRGVNFITHTFLFDKPLYGIESFVTIDKQGFLDNIATLKPKIEAAKKAYDEATRLTSEAFEKFKNNQSLKNDVERLAIDQGMKAQAHGILDGARQENQRYVKLAEAMQHASGSYVFSRHQFARDGNAIVKKRDETILQWSQLSGTCKTLLNQIGPTFNSERRKLIKELQKALNEYIRLAAIVGLYTGGAQADYELREKIPE